MATIQNERGNDWESSKVLPFPISFLINLAKVLFPALGVAYIHTCLAFSVLFLPTGWANNMSVHRVLAASASVLGKMDILSLIQVYNCVVAVYILYIWSSKFASTSSASCFSYACLIWKILLLQICRSPLDNVIASGEEEAIGYLEAMAEENELKGKYVKEAALQTDKSQAPWATGKKPTSQYADKYLDRAKALLIYVCERTHSASYSWRCYCRTSCISA